MNGGISNFIEDLKSEIFICQSIINIILQQDRIRRQYITFTLK